MPAVTQIHACTISCCTLNHPPVLAPNAYLIWEEKMFHFPTASVCLPAHGYIHIIVSLRKTIEQVTRAAAYRICSTQGL